MTFLQAALIAALALSAIAGYRRSRYDGTPPRAWWAQERQYRRPRRILTRLLRVLAGAGLLIASATAAITALVVLIAAGGLVALLAATWFWLRQAAVAAEPPVAPVERLATGDLAPEDLERSPPHGVDTGNQDPPPIMEI